MIEKHIRKLSLHEGDVILVDDPELAARLVGLEVPGLQFSVPIVILEDLAGLKVFDEGMMNEHGWYRTKPVDGPRSAGD